MAANTWADARIAGWLPGNVTKLGRRVPSWSRTWGATSAGGSCPEDCELLLRALRGEDDPCYASPLDTPGWRQYKTNGMDDAPDMGVLPESAVAGRLHVSGDGGRARVPVGPLAIRPLIRLSRWARLWVARWTAGRIPDGSGDTRYWGRVTESMSRARVPVFSYSHGWREWARILAPARAAGLVMLASTKSARQTRQAVRQGWRVAYHGKDVDVGSAYHLMRPPRWQPWVRDTVRLLVCPQQRGAREGGKRPTCETCQACWTPFPASVKGVAFADH